MKYLVVLLFSVSALGAERFDDWSTASESGNGYRASLAGTKDNYGSELIVLCVNRGKTECIAVVNFDLICEVGSTYPVLISHVGGSQALTSHCMEMFGKTVMYLPDQEQHIVNGSTYSVAIVKESGQFKSAHFSLKGSAKAYQAIIKDVADNRSNLL